jgi:hypothetical protein
METLMTTDLLTLAAEQSSTCIDLYLEATSPSKWEKLDPRIQDMLSSFAEWPHLTRKQYEWLEREVQKLREAEPLYGDFKAIWVMFQIAGEHLQNPKIRLMTEDDIFLQLTFQGRPAYYQNPETFKPHIELHRDGWQGHGKRRHIGQISADLIITPRYAGAITPSMFKILQEFALDPTKVAKACALKLGACGFCGSRLTDPESKHRGYGPVCAEHFQLPWGKNDEEAIAKAQKIANLDDLSKLF